MPKVKKRFRYKTGVFRGKVKVKEKEQKMSKRKGITLIELLIVVIILGALAALAIPRISTSATTAKQNTCDTNVDVINSQMEVYFAEKGEYPADTDALFADANYFPEGAPICAVDAADTYSLNGNGRAECSH
jgi:prepilin-type N-terminal cleavage/methylation domain-containing protein